jgi:hypothetical protein
MIHLIFFIVGVVLGIVLTGILVYVGMCRAVAKGLNW